MDWIVYATSIAAELTLAANLLASLIVALAVAVRWRWNMGFTKWLLLRVTIINYFVSPRVCSEWAAEFRWGRQVIELLRYLWILMIASGVLALALALEPLL